MPCLCSLRRAAETCGQLELRFQDFRGQGSGFTGFQSSWAQSLGRRGWD